MIALDDRLEALMAEHHGTEHHVLGQFLGLGFDHQDGIAGAGDDEVELRFRHVVDLRVQHEFAADIADARAPPIGPMKGHAGNGQRRRRRHHGDHVGVVFHVMAEDGDDDLGVVLVAVDEKRADRPVDQAREVRVSFFGRAPFAL